MFDYAITEELEKGIEEEDIENTRHIEEAESNDIVEENGEKWVISKFKLESGSLALVRTRFQQNGIYYDNQSLWGTRDVQPFRCTVGTKICPRLS